MPEHHFQVTSEAYDQALVRENLEIPVSGVIFHPRDVKILLNFPYIVHFSLAFKRNEDASGTQGEVEDRQETAWDPTANYSGGETRLYKSEKLYEMVPQLPHETLESIERDDHTVQPTAHHNGTDGSETSSQGLGDSSRKRKYSEFEADSGSASPEPPSKRRPVYRRPASLRSVAPTRPRIEDFPMSWMDFRAIATEVMKQVDWDDLALRVYTGYDGAAYREMMIALFRDRMEKLCAEQETDGGGG
ncbi:MAG: hypothetical protein M1840_005932 [Geoglossum simile]|nr:MAG: hypothetical protein M1840_005932 [Geoglossum simile]